MMKYRTKDEIELIAAQFMVALLSKGANQVSDEYLAKRAITCAFVFFTEIDKVGNKAVPSMPEKDEVELKGTTRFVFFTEIDKVENKAVPSMPEKDEVEVRGTTRDERKST